jgi:lipopolysaccharide/colanic/teichoic acid biosynthesis glycosyltransferase
VLDRNTLPITEVEVNYETVDSNGNATTLCTDTEISFLSSQTPKRILHRGSGGNKSEQTSVSSESLMQYNEWPQLSPWSLSWAKRAFDCGCVLLALPFWAPILILVGLAVRLTSRGPVIFQQQRAGRFGESFTILKFRTMMHVRNAAHRPVTTTANQRFTPIGPFLRRWKLDELPQVLNVITGRMSLVGPRPKLPEHTVAELPCRPGITGAATLAFAHEESGLAHLSQGQLDAIYHSLVLPAKHNLDVEYMARATFLSDLKLIVDSVVRRWDISFLRALVDSENISLQNAIESPRTPAPKPQKHRDDGTARHGATSHASVEETASA